MVSFRVHHELNIKNGLQSSKGYTLLLFLAHISSIHPLTLLKEFSQNLYRKEHEELAFINQTEASIMSGNHISQSEK